MCCCLEHVSDGSDWAMFGSFSALVNGKIKGVSIHLLGMVVSICSVGFRVCMGSINPFVDPLLLFTSAKCTVFRGFYVFVGVGGAGFVCWLL